MARPRRNKQVLALLRAKWLKYAASDHRPVRWNLSDNGQTIKRDYPPFGAPKRTTRQEEAYKYNDTWWLVTTKGKVDTASFNVKEIVPIQSMADKVYEEWLLSRGCQTMKEFCSDFGNQYEGTRALDTEWLLWFIKKFEHEIIPPRAKKRLRKPDPEADYGKRVRWK